MFSSQRDPHVFRLIITVVTNQIVPALIQRKTRCGQQMVWSYMTIVLIQLEISQTHMTMVIPMQSCIIWALSIAQNTNIKDYCLFSLVNNIFYQTTL